MIFQFFVSVVHRLACYFRIRERKMVTVVTNAMAVSDVA